MDYGINAKEAQIERKAVSLDGQHICETTGYEISEKCDFSREVSFENAPIVQSLFTDEDKINTCCQIVCAN